MSVWKKASKTNQKTHRERHQLEERKHLGLLEKKKDYLSRSKDYNDKKATLKLLRKRALNKNPDEFYHHMINTKIEDGKHFDKEKDDEDTPDQLKLMRSQDIKYISFKRTQELKKIERLQSQLHLSCINHNIKNKHLIFPKNSEEGVQTRKEMELDMLAKTELPDIDFNKLKEAAKKRKSVYKELSKRILREKELAIVQEKIELNRHLESKKSVLPPKKVRKGTKESAPIYKWKYERKK